MTMYQEGYEVYCERCEQFGLEPINFRYYIMQLSHDQLNAFNEQARTKKGSNEG